MTDRIGIGRARPSPALVDCITTLRNSITHSILAQEFSHP